MRRLLIVDDIETNRKILKRFLQDEYEILEAENGREALTIMKREHDSLSAVVLDLVMPEMNGYELLRIRSENPILSPIPVIIVTGSADGESQVRALSLGANDFMIKPYNPDVIRHCLANNITLRENASAINAMQRDRLTGILSREAFFDKAAKMIGAQAPGYYILACLDIDNFKVINDQYSTAEGDRILRHIADAMNEATAAVQGICCRISADVFAMLFPNNEETIRLMDTARETTFIPEHSVINISFSVGRYIVNDLSLPISAMYDRAFIAKQSIKGMYDRRFAYFDETMLEALVMEQQIIADMGTALARHQFEVWYQPQFNHATGGMIGAEALVRWRHPQKGLIPPASFIPIFEQNGFVYELDKYVWEQACIFLRRQMDAGRSPLPISVNVSRYDVFKDDLIDVITALTGKYGVSPELLHLEITESAFAQSSEKIIQVVKHLMSCGFTLEIDDFGSGYSSLNTLKDVPADVLKLDMRFLEGDENSQRGGNILESIVRMAKWIGMAVLAEGVETVAQANFLKSIGCSYVQGYLYAKPMPAEEYEALILTKTGENIRWALETVEHLDNNTFWDPNSMDTLIFNSFIGGACIFEYHNGRIEMLRVNDKFVRVVGSSAMTTEAALKMDWAEHFDPESLKTFVEALELSIKTRDEVTGEFLFLNLPHCARETYLRISLRVIASAGVRHLVYCTNENITQQKLAEQREHETSTQLRAIMNNVSGGVTAVTIDHKGGIHFYFANEKYYEMLGYTPAQFNAEVENALDLIHPEDRAHVDEMLERVSRFRVPADYQYRAKRRTGEYIHMRCSASVTSMEGVEEVVMLSVMTDITELIETQQQASRTADQLRALMDAINGGVTVSVLREGRPHLLYTNDMFYAQLGYTKEQFEAEVENAHDRIHPEDRARVVAETEAASREQKPFTTSYRVIRRDGTMAWLQSNISITRLPYEDSPAQLAVASDITAAKQAEQELRETDEQIRFLNDLAHDLLAQPDCDAAIDDTLHRLLEYFAAERAYAFELDYKKETFTNTYEVCAEGVASEKAHLQGVPFDVLSFWLHAFDHRNSINIRDVDALEDTRPEKELLQKQGIRSLIAVPLRRDGVLIGFIGIDDPTQQQTDANRLEAIGDYIAVLLTRRDLNARINSESDKLQQMMREMPGGFVQMQVLPDGSIIPIFFNEGFLRLVSMTYEEAMTLYAGDVMMGLHPDDYPILQEAVASLLEQGELHSPAYRLRSGRGGYVWVVFYGCVVRQDNGDVFLNVYYTDASEQSKLEQERRELLDNLPCGAALYELSGDEVRVTHLNKRYRELVGREIPDYADLSVYAAIHPDDHEKLTQELHSALSTDRDVDIDLRLLHGQGDYRTFHVTGRAVPRADGVHSLYVTFTPIPDKELSFRQMLPTALDAVMRTTPDMAFVKDRDLRFICCSHAFALLSGFTDEKDMVGTTDYDFLPKEFADMYTANEREILATGKELVDMEELLRSPDGSAKYVSTSKYPLMGADGSVIGIYGIIRDTTEYHTAFDRLRLLTNNIPGGIASLELSPKGLNVTYFNEGIYAGSGYTREEFTALTEGDAFALAFEEDQPALREAFRALHLGQEQTLSCTYRRRAKDGTVRWFNLRGMVSGRRGDITYFNVVHFDITEQKETEERLRIATEQFRIAAAIGERIIARYDIVRDILHHNDDMLLAQGFPRDIENASDSLIASGAVEPDSAAEFTRFFRELREGAKSLSTAVSMQTPGGYRWCRMDASAVYNLDGRPLEAVLVFTDVTEQREKEAIYVKWQQSLRERDPKEYTLFQCNLSKNASFDVREGHLLRYKFNDAVTTFDGRTQEFARQSVYPEDRAEFIQLLDADALLAGYYRGVRSHTMELREMLPDGSLRWLRLSVDLVEYPDSADIKAYLMYENIDESKQAELATLRRAETDALTGILNRGAFAAKTDEMIRAARPGASHALIMLDVDGFKQVNDTFGHATGDQALIDIAQSLRTVVRPGDLLGRLGGDEFVLFLHDIPDDATAANAALRICALLRRSFRVEVRIGASVGIAVCPRDGEDFESLYQRVDTALYFVKGSGKDHYAFYHEDMSAEGATQGHTRSSAAPLAEKAAKRHMLLIDDGQLDRVLLEELFRDSFILDTVTDAATAATRLRHFGNAASAVLLSLALPKNKSFALLEELQRDTRLHSIPVVAINNSADASGGLRAIQSGAVDFVDSPIDPTVLRARVFSAVSKAENELLRIQNDRLKLQQIESHRYRAALMHAGIAVVEYNTTTGHFTYDDPVFACLAGTYDDRGLCEILLSDAAAEPAAIRRFGKLLEDVAQDKTHEGRTTLRLKTPGGELHRFAVSILKPTDGTVPAESIIITFTDTSRGAAAKKKPDETPPGGA